MAKTKPAPGAASSATDHPKLPRLPKNTTIQKRPLMHPPIASPLAGSSVPKVIYISSKTPFIATIKRVQKYLSESDKRSLGRIDLMGPGSHLEKLSRLGKGRGRGSDGKVGDGSGGSGDTKGMKEVILVKGTGRAIERALQVGLWFQAREGYDVRLRTGSVGAIDDIVVPENETGGLEGMARDGPVDGEEEGQVGEPEVDVPETRLRRTSMLEVGISLA